MNKVIFEDVVVRANTKEDRFNTDKIYYVGGEHVDSKELLVKKKGIIKGSTIGPMFYFGFKKGQVLYVSRNPHLKKASMATFDGICSEKTFVLETKDEKVLLQDFLPLLMQTDHFWKYVEENKSGSVNFFVNWGALSKYTFRLPSINEQKEISDLVWSVNNVKDHYKVMISNCDELLESYFYESYKDVSKKIKLNSVVDILKKSGVKAGEGKSEGAYPFFTSSSVQDKWVDDYIYDDECMIVGSGGTASINYCNGKFSASTDNFVIKSKNNEEILTKFIYLYLLANIELLQKGFKGAGIEHLSKEYLLNIEIPLITYKEQVKAISFANNILLIKEKYANCLKDGEILIEKLIDEKISRLQEE